MNIAERLRDLALEGWRFWLDEGRLRFRAPDGPSRDAVLAELREHRDAVRAALESSPTLCDLAPLSDGQRALWFLWRLAPDSAAYNQSLPLRLQNAGAPDRWRRACAALATRHPILRTIFFERQGEPVQQVVPPADIEWKEIATDQASLTARIAEAHAPAFDLSSRPALRFRWFAVEHSTPVLLITFHHIICDGWTLELLRRELPLLADGATLPPMASTYQDFVWWQRHLLTGADGDRLRAFWHAQLAAPRPVLNLPLDAPRPPVQTYDGDIVSAPVPAALDDALRALAAREDTSSSVVYLAAYATMLARWSRSDEVIVGMPTSGRTRPEFSGVAGYFVEPVALRLRIDQTSSWRSLVSHTRRVVLDALEHADMPFARIVEELGVDRDASRSPVFDASFNFNSRRLADQTRGSDRASASVEAFDIDQAAGKFDLTCSVYEDQAGTHLTLGYRRDLFERATIERVMTWLIDALSTMTTRFDEHAGAASSTTPVTAAISGRHMRTDTLVPVVSAILRHSATDPSAIAVVAEDGRLTYGELARRVTDMAHALRSAGAGAGANVGVLAGRNSHFVVGMLAAMASGAAWVPLDPSDPPALLRKRMHLAGVVALIADDAASTLASAFDLPVISHAVNGVDVPALPEPSLDDDAYVIFTSGSTGEPKGVAVGHLALANYVASICEDLALPAGASHGFISATTADLGHTAIFPALVTGGSLHVLPEHVATNPAAFAAYLRDTPVDFIKIVPSHFAALAGEADGAMPRPRRGIIFGGESTPRPLVERLRQSGCRVFNHYGPTETTIGVLTHTEDGDGSGLDTLPLSRAVANTDIYLLDADEHSVPMGWPGEVCIGGLSLARGYVGDPVRTAERFVTLRSGARVYRTGDLARQRNDGALVLLGRNDRQIKLHGHRVELGHIDAALAALAGVQQAVVLPDVDGPAATRLAAWVVPAVGASPTSEWVRAELAATLPRHLIPSQIAIVREIPRTTNGKIDVHALRASLTATSAPAVAASQPLDDMEWRVLQLWRDVLRAPALAPTDDFFASGGHSLMAVRLAGRMADALGTTLPIAAFFTHRTARDMARLLKAGAAELPVLLPLSAGDTEPLLLFPGAGGDILYFSDLASALQGRQSLWAARGLRAPRPATVEDAAARYIALIAASGLAHRPLQLAGHSFGALVALEVARQARGTAIQIAHLFVLDQAAPASGASEVPSRSDVEWLRHIALRIGKLFDLSLTLPDAGAGYDDGVAALVQALHEKSALAADVRTGEFRQYVDGYKIDARAAALYRPAADPVDLPITVCNAALTDAELGAAGDAADPSRGWQAHTRRTVTTVTIPGTHITMLKHPHVAALAACLTGPFGDTR